MCRLLWSYASWRLAILATDSASASPSIHTIWSSVYRLFLMVLPFSEEPSSQVSHGPKITGQARVVTWTASSEFFIEKSSEDAGIPCGSSQSPHPARQ